MNETILNKATEYLARREHSRFELREKLLAENFDASEIDAVLDDLIAKHLQDDTRFAENYVRVRKQSGYGPERIARELHQKGISYDVIKQVVNANSMTWRRHMVSLLERRFGGSRTNQKEKMRFLLGRGYNHEEVLRSLNQERSVTDD